VIKVESPDGDPTRQWGPPFVEYSDGGRDAAYFHACNRGKRSVVCDFTQESGRARVRALAQGADVVIENYRRGDLARYGLDAPTLRAASPQLVWCSITGFGQDGPYADRPGYDLVVQAMGGIMDLTGEAGRGAQKPGVAYADLFTGLYSVIAIQAALADRARTGHGAVIDMALFDTQIAVLANQSMNFLVSGVAPARMGTAHPNLVPYQAFAVADGELVIAVGSDAQFAKLAAVLGIPDLATDPRARRNADRVLHRAFVVACVADRCRAWKRAGLQAALDAAGVPAGPVNTVAEVFSDPQAIARGMVTTLHARDGEPVPTVRFPVRMPGIAMQSTCAAPRLGQHQDASWVE
jgi:crotonobetainyl-CoA:carnitine CoA-transferase CaiB-like acyl-CoA transferase